MIIDSDYKGLPTLMGQLHLCQASLKASRLLAHGQGRFSHHQPLPLILLLLLLT